MDIVLAPYRRYFEFSGRSRRLEFGVFVLVNIVASLVLVFLDMALGLFDPETEAGVLSSLYGLFVVIPNIALGVRRLHDTGNSGWWFLLVLVPLLNLILFLYLLLKRGTDGPNRFGSDPKTAVLGAG
ncbi:MAG: DUF805 domain-containing protein [Alphaproteobacteria bacterium]|nr:DUF805 domain-containing protein [Alphaproteobacteria bacterium]MCB9930834.1 DUF805 domain-containing protein [Alphaproteobacteria bacterium]